MRGMLLFQESKAIEGQSMEGKSRGAIGGQVASEDQAGVQMPGWEIWRMIKESIKSLRELSILR